MLMVLGFEAARAKRSGTRLAPAAPLKTERRESMTTSEKRIAAAHHRRRELWTWRREWWGPPASCSLKSALISFFKKAIGQRQLKINTTRIAFCSAFVLSRAGGASWPFPAEGRPH